MPKDAVLALENGAVFHGVSVGAEGYTVGEVVFNTAMTGYQEILTDPSYARQIVTLTYPHIGNTGINRADVESARIHCAGLIVRSLSPIASNYRSDMTLDAYLQQQSLVAIAEIDTRKLTRILREEGAQRGCIDARSPTNVDDALARARACESLQGMDLASVVSTTTTDNWSDTNGDWRLHAASDSPEQHVVVYDFGVKYNILRLLREWNCRVTLVPAKTPASEVLALKPDGVLLANGPGDPAACGYAIEAIGELLRASVPIFGICLGMQLLALAGGAKAVKMKFGHHGANHPVIDLESETVMITSQNHGFMIDEASLPSAIRATHRSLFDQSLQGIAYVEYPAFGVQGHPEASPGPHDMAALFAQFSDMMQRKKHA